MPHYQARGLLAAAGASSLAGSDLNAEQTAGVARALAKEIEEEEVGLSGQFCLLLCLPSSPETVLPER